LTDRPRERAKKNASSIEELRRQLIEKMREQFSNTTSAGGSNVMRIHSENALPIQTCQKLEASQGKLIIMIALLP